MKYLHTPVMLEEVVKMLDIKASGTYLDATLGTGGHAYGILSTCGGCTLIGIDRDEKALKIAAERLKGYNVYLVKDTFSNMQDVIRRSGYSEIDGIVMDLGVSSLQLKSEGRGFSFLKDETLDMRMDKRQELTALKIVNEYPEKELARVLWQYGEEKNSRKIARAIVIARQKSTVRTCLELAKIIERTIRKRGRIHPATKTFQALRIEVNKELVELSLAMNASIDILKKNGRLCVISYHSLEDRIVKQSFKQYAAEGKIAILTKKPIVPRNEEKRINPSARSAKLRVAERI
jgi:16S rRNA (cytosine1402-N4)-methyltransferase